MNDPKVSIVIPVYNAEKHIHQCLESLINQTLKEIEIICVNDGSTDNSIKIIEDLQKTDDRIKYYSMGKNSGSGLARNKGMENAKGEYISFVDSDDHIIGSNAYEEIYEFAHNKNADIVSTNLKGYQNDEYFMNEMCHQINEELPISPQDYGIPWYHQKNLYKRSFLNKNKIDYPDYNRGQDPVFLAKVLKNVDVIYCLLVDFYAYRKYEKYDKINSKDKELDYIKHFRDVFDILDINTFKETHIKYKEKMYDFFVKPNLYFSADSLEKNVMTVFGENSEIFTIYKLKTLLYNKENTIRNLKSSSKYYKNRRNFIRSHELNYLINNIIRLNGERLNLQIDGKKLDIQIKYLIEEFYEISYLNNIGRSVGQILLSKFPSLYIIFNRNNSLKNAILNIKGFRSIKNNDLFDTGYYLRSYLDIRKSGKDPILHYILHGYKEGKNPNPSFDTDYYLSKNPAVKELDINPLVHYILYGQKEKRKISENQELTVTSINSVDSSEDEQKFIEVTFNQPIKAGTKWIELKNNVSESIPTKIKFFKNRIFVIPSKQLSKSTEYKLILHSKSITDIYKNPLARYTSNFLYK